MRDWLERLAWGQPAVLDCGRDADMPNRDSLFRGLCILGATVAGVASIVPWLFGLIVIMATAGSEYHEIQNTGRPGSQCLLKFTDWRSGTGGLGPSHVFYLPPESVITEYRVGRAYGSLTKMVFYEAKYRLPDGSVRVAPADGPEPLLSHREDVLLGWLVGGPIASCAFFVLYFRLRHTSLRENVHPIGTLSP